MGVWYATQILSNIVASILRESRHTKVQETVKLCRVFNLSFNCLNLRSGQESKKKLKHFLELHDGKDEQIFDWVSDTFLPYLE